VSGDRFASDSNRRFSAAFQSESSSTDAATSPDNLPPYRQQHTATDEPEVGSSKHLPMSATSRDDTPPDRTGSPLRESNTGHRRATHRCHKMYIMLQYRRSIGATSWALYLDDEKH